MAADFEQAVLVHLDAAHNLARWLTGSNHDAEDVVQEAMLRAWRFQDSLRGADGRAWLLAIVRHTCWTWLRRNRPQEPTEEVTEDLRDPAGEEASPPAAAARAATADLVRAALEALPAASREMVILHDLEGLTYRQVAEVVGVPLGTVMSRLARARRRLHDALADRVREEV